MFEHNKTGEVDQLMSYEQESVEISVKLKV